MRRGVELAQAFVHPILKIGQLQKQKNQAEEKTNITMTSIKTP